MAKGKGTIYALFVAANAAVALSTPEDITEYELVGNRKGTGITNNAPSVDMTDSEDNAMSNVPGLPNYSVTGTFNNDHAGDAGQNIMRTALKTGVQIHWLLTPVNADSDAQQAGLLQHRGTGSVEDFSDTHGHESPSEVSANIKVNGQYVTETVAT